MPCRRTALRREKTITAAIAAVRRGESVRDAATKHNIPKYTLHYRLVTPMRKKLGRPTALTVAEEQRIVDFILRNAVKGMPLTQLHLREAISAVPQRKMRQNVLSHLSLPRRILLPFKSDMPSLGYLRAFRKRHSNVLKFGRPLRQEAKRFRATNAVSLSTHFATMEKLIFEHNIDAKRIFNLDEVGVTPSKDATGRLNCKRLMPKSGIQDFVTADFACEHRVTMMPTVNPIGDCAPTLFVIKGKRVPFRQVIRNGKVISETPLFALPRESVWATRAENGGVDRYNFLSWAWKFVDYTKDLRADDRKVLLVYDAYRSHIST